MNELEELKARAAERRNRDAGVDEEADEHARYEQAEADLDRAIALAESRQVVEDVNEILAANARNVDEHDKAIAAALALRETVRTAHDGSPFDPDDKGVTETCACSKTEKCGYATVLADTAWLEEHR